MFLLRWLPESHTEQRVLEAGGGGARLLPPSFLSSFVAFNEHLRVVAADPGLIATLLRRKVLFP